MSGINKKASAKGLAILAALVDAPQGAFFRSVTAQEQRICASLNGARCLSRDQKVGQVWYLLPAGRETVEWAQSEGKEFATHLVGTVELLDDPVRKAPAANGPYQVMPPLSADDYAALEADIIAHGVLVPVEYDEAGNILDGHNRVAICESLGLVDWPRFVRKGLSEDEKRQHALQLNLSRRHLNTEQKRAIVADELRRNPGASSRAVAAMVGVHHSTVSAVRIGLESTGEISQLEATTGRDGRERRRKPMRTMFLPRKEDLGELKSVAKAIRSQEQKVKHEGRLRHMELVANAGAKTAGTLSAKFPVIYADPPWKFGVRSEVTGREKSAENHYPTMETTAICSLFDEIGNPASRDAVLFLWATNPMLPDALRVVEAWGFTYVHHWIWDKEVAGTGYWGRDQHELLLIGRRGEVASPLPGTQPGTIHRERKTAHSVKPAWFAEQIEGLFPGLSKLEMFCRSPRPGWRAWGFETGETDAEREVA